jgi:hypothetical protein
MVHRRRPEMECKIVEGCSMLETLRRVHGVHARAPASTAAAEGLNHPLKVDIYCAASGMQV